MLPCGNVRRDFIDRCKAPCAVATDCVVLSRWVCRVSQLGKPPLIGNLAPLRRGFFVPRAEPLRDHPVFCERTANPVLVGLQPILNTVCFQAVTCGYRLSGAHPCPVQPPLRRRVVSVSLPLMLSALWDRRQASFAAAKLNPALPLWWRGFFCGRALRNQQCGFGVESAGLSSERPASPQQTQLSPVLSGGAFVWGRACNRRSARPVSRRACWSLSSETIGPRPRGFSRPASPPSPLRRMPRRDRFSGGRVPPIGSGPFWHTS